MNGLDLQVYGELAEAASPPEADAGEVDPLQSDERILISEVTRSDVRLSSQRSCGVPGSVDGADGHGRSRKASGRAA